MGSVAHRGPDGVGLLTEVTELGMVTLGHARLAIIDLTDDGAQPMSDESGRYTIVFNGCIYNHDELRKELQLKGYSFRTKSDTEVLLNSYRCWKDGCLDRLRGMFAFVIWDRKAHRAFVARDRFGIKPIYLLKCHNRLVIASEIKQILAIVDEKPTAELSSVYRFLTSGQTDYSSQTMFEGINRLLGGELLIISMLGGNLKIEQKSWYRLKAVEEREVCTPDDYAELFQNTIKSHLVSDTPIGGCLSGGIDSSAIMLSAAKELTALSGDKIHAVHSKFAEKKFDESHFALDVAKRGNMKLHEISPSPSDLMDNLDSIMFHHDEPFGSLSIFAQWEVFKKAKDLDLKVMLDGQGADELFGGYLASLYYAARVQLDEGDIQSLIRLISANFNRLELRHLKLAVSYFSRQMYRHFGNDSPPNLTGFLKKEFCNHHYSTPPQKRIQTLNKHCIEMVTQKSLPMLLKWEDTNSMAHGIEARVPFVDHHLVENTINLRHNLKINRGTTKFLLRESLKSLLPVSVYKRRSKLGFSTPEMKWMKEDLNELYVEGFRLACDFFPDIFAANSMDSFAKQIRSTSDGEFWPWRLANLGYWAAKKGL